MTLDRDLYTKNSQFLYFDATGGIRVSQTHPFLFLLLMLQYAISQLRIVRSGLHLVTYLDVGNFCDKSTETTLHEMCVHVFLRFFDSNKPSQSVSLIYVLAWLAGIGKSDKNLLKTACKVAPLIKVAHIFWWRHDNRKQSASARERWCDVSCDIPYWGRFKAGINRFVTTKL